MDLICGYIKESYVEDPVALLSETFTGLVRLFHQRGPIVRAVADAAPLKCVVEGISAVTLDIYDG